MFALIGDVKRQLAEELAPDGYNVGFNAGAVEGQTVMHLHVHVIPRFRGDLDGPRGGVPHVIPSKRLRISVRPTIVALGIRSFCAILVSWTRSIPAMASRTDSPSRSNVSLFTNVVSAV